MDAFAAAGPPMTTGAYAISRFADGTASFIILGISLSLSLSPLFLFFSNEEKFSSEPDNLQTSN